MKTGIIKVIYDNGTFNSHGKLFYSYKMLIQFPNEQKQTEGEINSLSHPYPLGMDDEITVEASSGQHGLKFKKVNSEYAGQSGGGQTNPTARTTVQSNGNKDEMICRQTAGKVAGEVVAAMIRMDWQSLDVNSKLLEISDIMSMWFIEGTKKKKPDEDDIGF